MAPEFAVMICRNPACATSRNTVALTGTPAWSRFTQEHGETVVDSGERG